MSPEGLAANNLPIPIEDAIKAILNVKEKEKKSADTIRSYKSIFTLFADYIKKKHPTCFDDIASITKKEFRAYSQYMVNEAKYAAKTHNNHLTVLSNFFDECIYKDFIETNPATSVKLLPSDKGEKTTHIAFDEETRIRITKYLTENDPELLFFQKCIFYFAIRPKELRLMKIGYIDLKRKQVTVPAYDDGEKIAKTGQTKIIGIPEVFLPELIEQISVRYGADAYLFSPQTSGGQIPHGKDVMNRRFHKVKEALNLPAGLTNYGWKHTAADALFDSPDIKEESIQQHYRHSSLGQTQEYARNRGKRLNTDITEHYPKF